MKHFWSIFILLFPAVNGVAIDNGIVGEPTIDCTETEIHFEVKTQKPFAGRIYAKGKVDDVNCVKSNYVKDKTSNPTLDLPFGNCGIKGMRSLEPQGMYYVITLVVSFHPMFVTKVDKAFYVKCFFAESKFAVTANIGVSMIATTEAVGRRRAGECFYSIHKGTLEEFDKNQILSPPLQYAQVGDKILHRWYCPDPMFGLFLHDCVVSDGFNETAVVIDSRGCPVDPILISAIRYSTNLTEAFAESHVFKFADKPGVFFSCKIQQCMIMSGDCNKLTPPACATLHTGAPVIGGQSTQIEPLVTTPTATVTTSNVNSNATVPTPAPFTPTGSPPVNGSSTSQATLSSPTQTLISSPPSTVSQSVTTAAPPLPPYGGGIAQQATSSTGLPTAAGHGLVYKADSVLSASNQSPTQTAAGNLFDKIALEKQNYFWSLRQNDSVVVAEVSPEDESLQNVNEGHQLTGRLIIYDLDEIPPNSNYRSPEASSLPQDEAYLFTSTNKTTVLSNPNHLNNFESSFQCIISSQALTMIVASFGSICGLLMLILLVLCLKFRQRTVLGPNYRHHHLQQNSNNRIHVDRRR